MACPPLASPGLGIVTRGLSPRSRGHGIATRGLLTQFDPIELAHTITPVTPSDGATDVTRSTRLIFRVLNEGAELELDTLEISLAVSPAPPQGGTDIIRESGAFQVGFQGPHTGIDVTAIGPGQEATITVEAQFGWMPGATYTISVSIEDCAGDTHADSWSFTTVDAASTAQNRPGILRYLLAADRYGWDPLMTTTPSYQWEADPAYTGSRIELDLNGSLAADIVDQFGESLFGLDTLNGTRRYRLLAKDGEHPVDAFDPQATVLADDFFPAPEPVFADRTVPGPQTHLAISDPNRMARKTRYYTLFLLLPPTDGARDWSWAYADPSTFGSAYGYGRYGHAARLFAMLPYGLQVADQEQS